MEDQIQAIRDNALLAVRELAPLSGIDFGFNQASVEWVEGYIERLRVTPDFDCDNVDGLVSVLGSFLGECIIACAGGNWRWSESQKAWGIEFSNDTCAFPITKVRKLFDNGLAGGDSIVSFFRISVDYVATGKLTQASASGPKFIE